MWNHPMYGGNSASTVSPTLVSQGINEIHMALKHFCPLLPRLDSLRVVGLENFKPLHSSPRQCSRALINNPIFFPLGSTYTVPSNPVETFHSAKY